MNDEPNDVARWAAMQDAAAAKGAENRAKQREAKPTGARKADDKGDGNRHGVTIADLDTIHQRRVEDAADAGLRGEMEFARCIGAAPSLVSAFQKLKDDGRA